MAYRTGVVTSPSELLTVITDFAVANGWASSAGGILNKGGTFVRLSAPDATQIRIEGSRTASFSGTDLCGRVSRICNTPWPASAIYHIAAFDNPDTVWVTINFDTTKYQHLGFGSLKKYGDWVGGGWFHGHHTATTANSKAGGLIGSGYVSQATQGTYSACILFWSQQNYLTPDAVSSNLHCELRGLAWEPKFNSVAYVMREAIQCPTVIHPMHLISPNAFNGQTILTPFQLFLDMGDGYLAAIGHVGHLRFVKLTNYNPGDKIDIGGERWIVFPWTMKDASNPNGLGGSYSGGSDINGGLGGIAVKYDGA